MMRCVIALLAAGMVFLLIAQAFAADTKVQKVDGHAEFAVSI